MKSPRDHITSGLKNVGFDGGLDLKTDPVQVPPPATTTADNVWHITPGQARSLPSGTAFLLPVQANMYNMVAANASPPYSANGVLAIQEQISREYANYSSSKPQLIAPTNPNIPLSPNPCYQANFRTRIMNGASSYQGYGASETIYVCNDTPTAGLSPYAIVQPVPSLGYFNVTTGDLSTGATSTPAYYTLQGLRGTSGLHISNMKAIAIPGNTTSFLVAFQDTGGGSNVYIAVVPYNLGPATLYTLTGTATVCYDLFTENQNVWLACTSSTTNGTLQFWKLGTSNAGGPFAGAAYTGAVSGISATYCTGYGLALVTSNAASVKLYTIDDANWQTQTFTSPTFVQLNTQPNAVVASSVTVGLTLCDINMPTYAGASPGVGCVFFTCTETYSSGPSATTYGVRQIPAGQLCCVTFTTTSRTTLAGMAVGNTSYFRTALGTNIIAGCFTPNYRGPGGRAGPGDSTDFIVPVVTNPVDTVADPANVYSIFNQPKYFLINSLGKVVGRWGDDAGGGFTPPYYSIMRKTLGIIAPGDSSAVDFCIPFTLNYGLQNASTTPVCGQATYIGGGAPGFAGQLAALATFSYQAQNACCPPVYAGRSLVFGGSLTMLYDGETLHEAGFHTPPRTICVGTTSGVSNSGITITTAVNSTAATVSTTKGLYIGQSVSGTGIPSGTTIVDIPSLTTVTLSNAATAAGSVTLTTACQYQYIAIHRWVDAQGLVHRSAPSRPTQVNFQSSAATFGTVNGAIPLPDATYKYLPLASTLTCDLYRTVNNGTQYYLVQSFPIYTAPPQVPSNNLGDFYTTFTDTTSDNALQNPIANNSTVILDRLYTSADGSYSSFAPPPFIWQVASGGRLYGLACVESFWRVYFSQQWDESSPPEFNNFCYLPVPPELGDCRSMAVYQNNIIVFASKGIATFSGAGPARQLPNNKDGTTANGAALAFIYNSNFTLVTPLPSPSGVRGSGAPVTMPNGIIYQDRAGFTLLDGSLNLTPIGTKVEPLTGTLTGVYPNTIYGHGTLCEALSAAVWANPQGASLVYDYKQDKWSTWSGTNYTSKFVEAHNKTVYQMQQKIIGGQITGSNYPNVLACTSFNLPWQVETPWLSPSPVELDVGQTNSYSSSVGEGNIWEAEIFGQWIGPHAITVETAINYGPYKVTPGYLNTWALPTAPAQYQFRIRPPGTTRIWAIRYRVSIATGTQGEMARLGGIVLYCGVDSSVTRLGRGGSL